MVIWNYSRHRKDAEEEDDAGLLGTHGKGIWSKKCGQRVQTQVEEDEVGSTRQSWIGQVVCGL